MTLIGIATGAKLHAGKNLDATLDAIAASGAHAIRMGADWPLLEPHLGDPYDWSGIDPIVDGVTRRGMTMCLATTGRPGTNLYTPDIAAAYVKAAAAVAQRYEGRVAGFEGPNEPNHNGATATTFTDLICKPLYDLTKQLAPTAFVVTGSLGGEKNGGDPGTAADFVTGMYTAGAQGHFDALGFHPYSYPLSPHASVAAQTRGWYHMHQAHATMRTHGDHRPVWITENGCPTGGDKAMTEATCAQYLVEAITDASHRAWIGAYFHFTWADAPVPQDPANAGDWMGLVRPDGSHKLTYDAFKAHV